jgi:putative chitinase
MLTKEKFLVIFPAAKATTLNIDSIVAEVNASNLNTVNRMAGFLAQCGHESGQFRVVRENLNYSADGLRKVFPKYFPTPELAAQYARKPMQIASRVYANRMGNGTEASMDGWKYRGRGFIQLTGKNNYDQCGKDLGVDLINKPELVETAEYAVKSAVWFWQRNNLNRFADNDDIKGMTKAINGGYHGIDERTEFYNRAKTVLST